MRRSVVIQGAALAATAAVVGLSAAPATAATPVAQASATALTVSVAGSGTGTGTYSVTNDGTRQTSSGNNRPMITALGNQRLISAGTLAQDATTSASGGNGTSAACSGLAGDGASVVAAGDGNCLTGGQNLSLDVGHLDLSKLQVLSSPAAGGLDSQLQNAITGLGLPGMPTVQDVLDQINSQLLAAAKPLDGSGLYLDMGAVQSHCSATTTSASGDSDVADVALKAKLNGREITLAKLPVHAAPNTHVVTNLDGLTKAITDALTANLADSLDGQLAPLNLGVNQLSQVVNTVADQISKQLAPLQQNVLDATVNKQTRTGNSITVTALDLSILPAAKQFVGTDAIHLSVATSSCGPNGRVVAPVVAKAAPPKTTPKHNPPKKTKVPTVVTAGLADGSSQGSAGRTALAALLLLTAGGAGVATYRRALRR